MPLDFKNIEPEFTSRGLKVPKLVVLEPDAQIYDILAIQPTGKIAMQPGFIGHVDRDGAQHRFEDFLGMAISKNCAVALAPEYSCPWETLEKFVTSEQLPQAGKLWILGCEGIRPVELEKLIERCKHVVWIHEKIPTGTGSTLGVLAYLTRTENQAGESRHAIVLQFKTQAMGGDADERNLLIPGRAVYIWHNQPAYIQLVSIICADSLGFDQAPYRDHRLDVDPTIIFHPQLTADPLHVAMCAYRASLFGLASTDKLEVISLNWARGFEVPKKGVIAYGGSAIYTKAPQMDTSDGRVDANHNLGLYFTDWKTHRTKLCFFNFNEHIFHFRNLKVAHRGPGVFAQRTGPEMLSVLQWQQDQNKWVPLDFAVDGFAELCGQYNDGNGDYCLDNGFSHLDRERLLALSAGHFQPSKTWYKIDHLDSFTSNGDERCKRLTFTHEQIGASRMFRQTHMERYSKLQTAVLGNEANFPENIQDLKNDCQLRPPNKDTDFRFNLHSASGSAAPSTGVFMGVTPAVEAKQLFDSVVTEWGWDRTRRLVVWYERNNGQIDYVKPPVPLISDGSESPATITSGGDS